MTPEEKWKRLNNPKSHEDYGISLSESELETFDEGRNVLAELRQFDGVLNDQLSGVMADLGAHAGECVERVRYAAITAMAQKHGQ